MIDLRKDKVLDLISSKCLKEDATYLFIDPITQKRLIAKFFANYSDEEDKYLIIEFKKIALLSAEPEIATVYFLACGNYGSGAKSCYVMNFVDGRTLKAFIESTDKLTSCFSCELLQQIALGIEKAHHYEISHGDLHEENIMIDSFGYVKIIDFLWWDFKLSFEQSSKKDIEKFKELVNLVATKLWGPEKSKFLIFRNYLDNIHSFKSVAKNLSILNQISNDLSLINDNSKKILACIVSAIIPEATLMYILEQKQVEIPGYYISKIIEAENINMNDGKDRSNIKLLYSRLVKLQGILERVFNLNLHELRQCGLINWQMNVESKGEKFMEPYVLDFQIHFTYKLFEWKRLNEQFNFLGEQMENSLIDMILESNEFGFA
jgi:Protein kinase domain